MIEELTLILEALGGAGEGAFWFGVIWLAKEFILSSAVIGVWLVVVLAVKNIVLSFMSMANIYDELGVEYEKHAIKRIQALKEKAK